MKETLKGFLEHIILFTENSWKGITIWWQNTKPTVEKIVTGDVVMSLYITLGVLVMVIIILMIKYNSLQKNYASSANELRLLRAQVSRHSDAIRKHSS